MDAQRLLTDARSGEDPPTRVYVSIGVWKRPVGDGRSTAGIARAIIVDSDRRRWTPTLVMLLVTAGGVAVARYS
jgi:hypothetical protein